MKILKNYTSFIIREMNVQSTNEGMFNNSKTNDDENELWSPEKNLTPEEILVKGAQYNDMKAVEYALNKGANINSKDKY